MNNDNIKNSTNKLSGKNVEFFLENVINLLY